MTVFTGCSQKEDDSKLISQIQNVREMPGFFEISGDSIYWDLVKRKMEKNPGSAGFVIVKILKRHYLHVSWRIVVGGPGRNLYVDPTFEIDAWELP